MERELPERHVVESPEQAMALMNPLRAEILAHLKEPASASEVARRMHDSPQRVNYHLKTLEKVGLVRRAGTRQVKNLVEVLYQAIAKSFLLADSLGWSPETVRRIKDQGSLAHLIATSERLKRDAFLLMERSDANEDVPSATLHLNVRLADEAQRGRFVRDYVDMVKKLAERYQGPAADGETYQVVLAVYPEPANKEEEA